MTCGYLMTIARNVAVERLGAYSAALTPLYAKFGGRYLAMGGPDRGVECVGASSPRSVMLARFETLADIHAFWASPGYRAAVPLRDGCGEFTVLAFSGEELPPTATMLHVALEVPERVLAQLFAKADAEDVIEGRLDADAVCLWTTSDVPPNTLTSTHAHTSDRYRLRLRSGD